MICRHKFYHFSVANLVLPRRVGFCDRKMIQIIPANHSNTNRVITILIHSNTTHFQNVFVMLLHCVANYKDVDVAAASTLRKFNDFACIEPRSFVQFFNPRISITFRVHWVNKTWILLVSGLYMYNKINLLQQDVFVYHGISKQD